MIRGSARFSAALISDPVLIPAGHLETGVRILAENGIF